MLGLGKSYKEALGKKYGGAVAVFNYVTDFDLFWENGESPAQEIVAAASSSGSHALVIVWDGMPDHSDSSSKLISGHLTPLDWALAFSLRMLNLGAIPLAQFSIHIIDLTNQNYKDTYAMRMSSILLDSMSWLKLYAPLIPENARFRRKHLPMSELDAHVGLDTAGVETMAKAIDGQAGDILAELQNSAMLWSGTLLQSKDHHDMNNIVGPDIILNMLPATEREPAGVFQNVGAFMTRLDWMGLLPEVRKERAIDKGRVEFVRPVNLLVIDDQLSMGWDQVLAKLVDVDSIFDKRHQYNGIERIGSSQQLDLYGATGPEVLFHALGLLVNDGMLDVDIDLYKRREYDSPIPHNGDLSRPWALILDLRLFSGQEKTEKIWYRQLAAIASRIEEKAGDTLAWKGFKNDNIDILQKDFEFEEGLIDTALSLFPRLCALRWPSVPIIVFSASGRRGLTSKLAEYGNIFLSSPKPNVLSVSPDDQLEAFLDGWSHDVQQANSLLAVQKQLLGLKTNGSDSAPEILDSKKHTHVVVALDETGDFISYDSSVGGVVLFATGDDENKAIDAAKAFQETLRQQGATFYGPAPYYTDAISPGQDFHTTLLSKGGSIDEPLGNALADHKNVKLSVFQYSIPKKMFTDPNLYADASYLKGLAGCLELIFYELLPSVGVKRQTCSIWIPTKQTSYITQYYAKAAQTEYDKVFQEGRRNGTDYKAVKSLAHKAKKHITETLERQHRQDAVDDALRESRRFDFRLTRAGGHLVETIGGLGKAYSILLQTLSIRTNYEEVINGIRSIKVRKIPYKCNPDGTENNYGSHNVSVCSDCGHTYDQVDSCQTRGCPGTLQPDYSVMAHVADAAISANPRVFPNAAEIGEKNMDMALSFDVEDSHTLDDFLHISRLVDTDRVADAFKLAFKKQFFANGLNRQGSKAKAGLERRLLGRLKLHPPVLTGVDIMELSGLPVRNVQSQPGEVQGTTSTAAQSPPKPKYKKHVPTKQSHGSDTPQHKKTGHGAFSTKLQGRIRITINNILDPASSLTLVEQALSSLNVDVGMSIGHKGKHKGKQRIQLIVDSSLFGPVMRILLQKKTEIGADWLITENAVD